MKGPHGPLEAEMHTIEISAETARLLARVCADPDAPFSTPADWVNFLVREALGPAPEPLPPELAAMPF